MPSPTCHPLENWRCTIAVPGTIPPVPMFPKQVQHRLQQVKEWGALALEPSSDFHPWHENQDALA